MNSTSVRIVVSLAITVFLLPGVAGAQPSPRSPAPADAGGMRSAPSTAPMAWSRTTARSSRVTAGFRRRSTDATSSGSRPPISGRARWRRSASAGPAPNPMTRVSFHVELYRDRGGRPARSPEASVEAVATMVPTFPDGAFYSVDVSDADMHAPTDVFYLGVRWNPSEDGFFFVCVDQTAEPPRSSTAGSSTIGPMSGRACSKATTPSSTITGP